MRSRKQQRKDDCTEGQAGGGQLGLASNYIGTKKAEITVSGRDGLFGVMM